MMVIFAVLVLFVSNVDAIYWNRDFRTGHTGKRYFLQSLKYLSDMEIPMGVWNMPVCDKECLQKERQVLIGIHRNLRGKHWEKKWDVDINDTTLNTSFHCNWHGILCDNVTKHILGIDLSYNRLHGEVPLNAMNLKFLLSFRIGPNYVRGQCEKIVASMPNYLIRLYLAYTDIAGKIPRNIANKIPLLSKLEFSGSRLIGDIPESIGDLIHLTVLTLGETSIRGNIPQSISRLRYLKYVDLQALRLKGNLSTFFNSNDLEHLHLSSNEIIGMIPSDIGERCPNLTTLLLHGNRLSGNLPPSLGMLKKLRTLNVAKNNLSGQIPADLFNLKLQVLILSSNNFTGFENCSNCDFKNLNIFMAAHLPAFNCSLREVVSYLMGSEETIMQIDLSHSNMYGDLPGFVFNFRRLTFLKLASNQLSGKIPSPWTNLPYFTLLHLQHNDFSGPIPTTFSRLLMLTELNVQGNKRLKGPLYSLMTLNVEARIKERISDTCPMVRFAHNNGTIYVNSSYYNRAYCYCDEHFFGNGKHCKPCMHGGFCPGITKTSPHFKSAINLASNNTTLPVSTMFLNTGYFPFPDESDVKIIHKCPSSGRYYKICVPKEQCGCYVNTTEQRLGTQGRMEHRTRVHCNKSCLCLLGHHGRYCSQCIEGYYKEGIRCYQCPVGPRKGVEFGTLFGAAIGSILISVGILLFSSKRLKLTVFLALAEVVLVFIFVLRHLIPGVVLQIVIIIYILGFSSHLQRCTALLKSAMFYLQIMDSLISTTDVWPKSIYSIQVYISSSLNFCFSSLACILPSFFTLLAKNLMLFSLPILSIGLLWLLYCFRKLLTKPGMQKLSNFNCKCRKYSIIIIDLAYFPIVHSCFSVIAGCRNIEDVSFMKRYVWVDCSSSEHISLSVIAVLELILYVIAVPFFAYFPLLLRHRNEISDDSSPVSNWLSPLISSYKPKYRAFIEVFMLLRRLLIAVLMTVFPANSSLQIQCIMVLLLVAIIFHAVAKPFKSPTEMKSNDEDYCNGMGLENGIEIFMLLCVLLSFLSIGLSVGYGNSIPSTIFIITLVLNGCFVISFCCSVLYRLFRPGCNAEDCGYSPDLHEPLIDADLGYHSRDCSSS